MSMYRALLLLVMTPLMGMVAGCPGLGDLGEGDLRVRNDDPAASIVTIYVSENCDDRWGAPEVTGLNIPPGAVSPKIELDVDIYDVRACFDSGNCGDRFDQEVDGGDTVTVGVVDEGKAEADLLCY